MTFTVHPGQVTGFVGPNGAGKSTTIRVVLGLDAPDAGTATFGGRPCHSLKNPLGHVGSLLTGRYPRGMFDFVEGVARWHNRVIGYALTLVTDEYPPFRLAP
jgi:ABC-type Mn2+/Zn2+ transport system ATPase subunit